MQKSRTAIASALTAGTLAVGLMAPVHSSASTPDPGYVVNCVLSQLRTLTGGGPPDPGCQIGGILGALGL